MHLVDRCIRWAFCLAVRICGPAGRVGAGQVDDRAVFTVDGDVPRVRVHGRGSRAEICDRVVVEHVLQVA